MTDQQKKVYMKNAQAEPISPAEAEVETRRLQCRYHYLGCAKTFAPIGIAFAEANLALMRGAQQM